MSAKGTILTITGSLIAGIAGTKWFEKKENQQTAKKASAYTVAGLKIAGNAIKDWFEDCQAGYGDISADADEITKKYYADKDAKAAEKARVDAAMAK